MMKILVFICGFFVFVGLYGQKLPGTFIIERQSQLDSFVITYPKLNEYKGAIYLKGKEIKSLKGLSRFEKIRHLSIVNTSISDLSHLKRLRNVGYLRIRLCNELKNLSGLENIKSIESLDIGYNDKLVSINSLSSASFVYNIGLGSSIKIAYCKSLKNLEGLNNLRETDIFTIKGNDSILSLEPLASLRKANHILIDNNKSLSSIISLANIVSPKFLTISYNPKLSNCQLTSICEGFNTKGLSLSIENNGIGCTSIDKVYDNCGFETNSPCPLFDIEFTNQKQIDDFKLNYPDCQELGQLSILDRYGDITNLEGLSNIKVIKKDCQIIRANIKDFSGLSSVIEIGEKLYVSKCNKLTSFVGFDSLKTIGVGINLMSCNKVSSFNDLSNVNLCDKDNKRHLIYISGCDNLTSLNGLINVKKEVELIVSGNQRLVDISVVNDWVKLSILTLKDNYNLNDCNLLKLKSKPVIILENNGVNCKK